MTSRTHKHLYHRYSDDETIEVSDRVTIEVKENAIEQITLIFDQQRLDTNKVSPITIYFSPDKSFDDFYSENSQLIIVKTTDKYSRVDFAIRDEIEKDISTYLSAKQNVARMREDRKELEETKKQLEKLWIACKKRYNGTY